MAEEPVIYRQEALTFMALVGDLTFAAQRFVQPAENGNGEEDDED